MIPMGRCCRCNCRQGGPNPWPLRWDILLDLLGSPKSRGCHPGCRLLSRHRCRWNPQIHSKTFPETGWLHLRKARTGQVLRLGLGPILLPFQRHGLERLGQRPPNKKAQRPTTTVSRISSVKTLTPKYKYSSKNVTVVSKTRPVRGTSLGGDTCHLHVFLNLPP